MAGQTIGRYEVRRVLGAGGFATVWLARDPGLDTDVAVKVLAENWAQDADVTERFIEEARLLRRCDDDRVVRVHTIEQLEDGRPYFVMDYADAGTLTDRIVARMDAGRRFGVREAVDLSVSVAGCLGVVHAAGIVHRDLKPSNVLFRTGRDRERMMLGDLGVARQVALPSAQTILGGTPGYAAPEQLDPALAATVDARADLYAAAVVLYELLAGVPPSTGDAPDLAKVRPDVPPALAEVVGRGMATDAADRFPTVGDWAAALTAAIEGLPPDPPAPLAPPLTVPTPVPPFAASPPPDVPSPGPPSPVPPVPPPPVAPAPSPGPTPPVPRPPVAPASPAPDVPSPGPTPPVPPVPPPPVAPAPPPDVAAPPPRHRKPLWVLVAGILGAVALVIVVAVALGRGSGGSGSRGAAATTVAPTTVAPSTGAPATGVAAWFAAASGPRCVTAPKADRVPGVVEAVRCPDGSITGIFAEVGSATGASEDLTLIAHRRGAGAVRAWNGGEFVSYAAASGAAVAWTYTGQPYVGIAVGPDRSTVDTWWVTTGRVRA